MAAAVVPKGAALRKNAKAVVLPYGLGTLTHKQPLQLTARFSAASTQLLRTACDEGRALGRDSASESAAGAFASLLARLSVDAAEQPTASAVPALAAAIRGDAPPEGQAHHPQHRGGGAAEAVVSRAVPARTRGLYMPAGSPGAAAVDLGVSPWVETLRSTAWVPTAEGKRRPAEVLLREPTAAEQQSASHLLRATLPSAAMKSVSTFHRPIAWRSCSTAMAEGSGGGAGCAASGAEPSVSNAAMIVKRRMIRLPLLQR